MESNKEYDWVADYGVWAFITKGISAFPTLVLTLELHHAIASCQAFVVVRNTIVAAYRVQNF